MKSFDPTLVGRFRRAVQARLLALNLTDEQAAARAGVAKGTFSGWFTDRHFPRRPNLNRLLEVLGCRDLDELLGYGGPPEVQLHDGPAGVLTAEAFQRVEDDLKNALRSVEALRMAFAGPDPAAALASEIARRVQSDIRHANESDAPSVPGLKSGSAVRRRKDGSGG